MRSQNIFNIISILINLISFINGEPVIEIDDGILIGKYDDSLQGNVHSKFLGIPYAQPPVRPYLSTIPTLNSHINSHSNSYFLLSRSGNSFLKNSHFYLIRSRNLSGN